MFRRIKLLPSYKIDWNYNEKDIFGMLRGFDIINKASAQDYFEAGKTKDCDGEIFIITTHFRFCLFFNTCLFSGVKHNTSFLWKIKKKLSYDKKTFRSVFQEIKRMSEISIFVSIWFKSASSKMLTEFILFHWKKVFLKMKCEEIKAC